MKKSFALIILIALAAGGCGNKKQTTETPSIPVTGKEKDKVDGLFALMGPTFEGDSISPIFKVVKKADSTFSIQISFVRGTDTARTVIERTGFLNFANDNVCVDTFGSLAFICWISEPYYESNPASAGYTDNHRFELHFRVLDLNTDSASFDGVIYSTKCCIDRISMIYNPFTKSVHFSWNDFSRSNSRYLMFGSLAMDGSKLKNSKLEVAESVVQDASEKMFPGFLRNSGAAWLYHTTGSNWGAFSQSGIQQIGISKIDDKNQLTDYRLITDSSSIFEKIILAGDTLFFRLRIVKEGQADGMATKKVAIKDLPAFEKK